MQKETVSFSVVMICVFDSLTILSMLKSMHVERNNWLDFFMRGGGGVPQCSILEILMFFSSMVTVRNIWDLLLQKDKKDFLNNNKKNCMPVFKRS